MKADSLQGYLEQQLKVATNITPELIKQLKAQWRKDYVARYNKQYRDDHVQITFRLSKAEHKKLLTVAKRQQLKPTVYCRQLVSNSLHGNATQDMLPLRLLILELIDYIEEAEYENNLLDTKTVYDKVIQIRELL